MTGLTFSSDNYSEFKETGDKDLFERVVVDLTLENNSEDVELIEYINSLPKRDKRIAVAATLGDNVLWNKLNDVLNQNPSSYKRLQSVYFLLKDYVKIADVERKQHGEILTPFKELAEPMIKLVEKYDPKFWKNKYNKVLDSSAGYGTFLILAAYKFMVGLKDEIQDEEERFKWIVENCLYYGELQSKSVFSWLLAIDPYDEYKTNTYWGSFLADTFDKHVKEVWGVEKFDLIIQNPPYQEVVGAKKTQQIWGKFVIKSFSLLKDNGYMNFVHPGGWRFLSDRSMEELKNVKNIYLNNEIIIAKFHSYKDGLEIFGANTDFDVIFLKKIKFTGEVLISTKTDGDIMINLKNFNNIIPTDNISLFKKLTGGSEKVELIYSYSNYETRKNHISSVKDENFKLPVVYGYPTNGLKLLYSNIDRGHFGISKLILVKASIYSLLDIKGEYAMSQFAGAIIDTQENLTEIKKVVDSDKFKKLKAYFLGVVSQNTNAAIDAPGNMFKIIKEFKKDFWKELL